MHSLKEWQCSGVSKLGTFSVVGNSETGSVVEVMLSVDFKTLIFHV